MQVDVAEDQRLANLNLSDSVLCASIYTVETLGEAPQLLCEDTCIAVTNKDPRLVLYSTKQRRGDQLTESDTSALVHAYFDLCNSFYKSRFEKNEVSIKINLVTFLGECKNTDKLKTFHNTMTETHELSEIIKVVTYIVSSIGLIGNVLSLSVFCRPSFLAEFHIGYQCIARCCYDILMLVYCILSTYNSEIDFRDTIFGNEFSETKTITTIHCVSLFFCFMSSEIGTAFLTLAISFERLIAIIIPLKAKIYLNRRTAKKVTIGLVCLSILAPAGLFIYT